MMTNTANLTVSNLKKWARKNRKLGRELVLAQEFAKAERARVDAYITPILIAHAILDEDGDVITNPDRVWTHADSEENRVAEYYAACELAHRAHGFDGPKDHCPALIAECLLTQAENALLNKLCEFIGVKEIWSMELRDRAIELAIETTQCTLV